MAKPRKRKATTTRTKPTAKPAKRSTSRRRAVTPSDDDVFIPKASSRPVVVSPRADSDDNETVFVARPGRPVEVQSDLVEDLRHARNNNSGAPLGISNDEFWASLEPRAMTPGGWTQAQLTEHGLTLRRGVVVCRYGGECDGSTTNVPGVSSHHYTCPYWSREGKDKTPF
jgi:hypothetical protein